jgi:hypothetical protein
VRTDGDAREEEADDTRYPEAAGQGHDGDRDPDQHDEVAEQGGRFHGR